MNSHKCLQRLIIRLKLFVEKTQIWTILHFLSTHKIGIAVLIFSSVGLLDSISDIFTAVTAYKHGNVAIFACVVFGDYVGGLVTSLHHLMLTRLTEVSLATSILYTFVLLLVNPVSGIVLGVLWSAAADCGNRGATSVLYHMFKLHSMVRGTLESPIQVIILLTSMSVGMIPLPWEEDKAFSDSFGNAINLGMLGAASLALSSINIATSCIRSGIIYQDLEIGALIICNIIFKIFSFTLFFFYLREYTAVLLIWILLINLMVCILSLRDVKDVSYLTTALCSMFVLTLAVRRPENCTADRCKDEESSNASQREEEVQSKPEDPMTDSQLVETKNVHQVKRTMGIMSVLTCPAVYIQLLIIRFGLIDEVLKFVPDPNIIFTEHQISFIIDAFLQPMFWISMLAALPNLIGAKFPKLRLGFSLGILIGVGMSMVVYLSAAYHNLMPELKEEGYSIEVQAYRFKIEKLRVLNGSSTNLSLLLSKSDRVLCSRYSSNIEEYTCESGILLKLNMNDPWKASEIDIVNRTGLENLMEFQGIECGDCLGPETNMCEYLVRKHAKLCKEYEFKAALRDDNRCGAENPVNGRPGVCDPQGLYPCCSEFGYCNLGVRYCDCPNCKDYRSETRKREDAKKWNGKFRTDLRCGEDFPLPWNTSAVTECDPESPLPCCSEFGWCQLGVSVCKEGKDYGSERWMNESNWEGKLRKDNRCGPDFPLPDGSGNYTECDPESTLHPCCDANGMCSTSCTCPTCIDYRE